jgi:hypothetical protein
MTLAITTLNDISKRKTIISSIPMCYTKCRNAHTFLLQEVAYFDE